MCNLWFWRRFATKYILSIAKHDLKKIDKCIFPLSTLQFSILPWSFLLGYKEIWRPSCPLGCQVIKSSGGGKLLTDWIGAQVVSGEKILKHICTFSHPRNWSSRIWQEVQKIVNCILYMPQFATVSCLTIDKGWRYSSFSCGLIFWGVEEYGTDITISSKLLCLGVHNNKDWIYYLFGD